MKKMLKCGDVVRHRTTGLEMVVMGVSQLNGYTMLVGGKEVKGFTAREFVNA